MAIMAITLCILAVSGLPHYSNPSRMLLSKEDVNGLCNLSPLQIKFVNTETSGNDCTAVPHGDCFSPGKRAFIPKCDSQDDYSKHHFELQGLPHLYSIWKHDGDQIIYGTQDGRVDPNGRGLWALAHYSQGDYWNIIVNPDGGVWLKDGSLPCPTPPPQPSCDAVHSVNGHWVNIGSSQGPTKFTFTQGVSHETTHGYDKTWGSSVGVKMSSGFKAFGADMNVEVDMESSKTIAQSYSSTLETSSTSTEEYDFNTPGVIWQWQFYISDSCGNSKVLKNDLRITPNVMAPPCCLPGFERNIKYPHAGGCLADGQGKVTLLCKTTLIDFADFALDVNSTVVYQ